MKKETNIFKILTFRIINVQKKKVSYNFLAFLSSIILNIPEASY